MLKKFPNYLMCIVSGLLLGLAVPCFSWLPLGFFAWLWLVPLLFELKRSRGFGEFVKLSLSAVGIGFTLITFWVVNASVIGFLASTLMGVFVWTIPFVSFYILRRKLGWNAALWTLPFFWTAWEWLYHQTDFSFGAVRLGYTQADLLWLIQFADLTGIEGVTFWILLVNAAIFTAFDKIRKGLKKKNFDHSLNLQAQNFLYSQLSPLLFPILLLILPLLYRTYIFLKPEMPRQQITVYAVQPNATPFVTYTPKQTNRIFGRQIALTDRAVEEVSPDLIIWHEAAVPYILSENAEANSFLAKQITKWNAPLLTGLIEVKNYAPDEPRPLLLEAQNRSQEFFNAAALFEPENAGGNVLPVNLDKMYLKRRLMPFLEQVPFADRYPFLDDLKIPIGVRPRLSRGERAATFEVRLKNGRNRAFRRNDLLRKSLPGNGG